MLDTKPHRSTLYLEREMCIDYSLNMLSGNSEGRTIHSPLNPKLTRVHSIDFNSVNVAKQ